MAKKSIENDGKNVDHSRGLPLPKRRWYLPRTWRRNIPLPPRRSISSTWRLLKQAIQLLRGGWKTYLGIALYYALGVFIFVRSFSLSGSATALVDTTTGGKLAQATERLAATLSDAGSSISAASGVYQVIISTICCLALIWAFRQQLSKENISVRRAFYEGMTPLIKYFLVLLMLAVQLIPVAIGGYFFGIILGTGLFLGPEIFISAIILMLLGFWSGWLVTHTVFALFICTLPDMTPLKALRSAKKMVYKRRLLLWRKFIVAVIIATLACAIIVIPVAYLLPAATAWLVFLLGIIAVPLSQAFLYMLYREIL